MLDMVKNTEVFESKGSSDTIKLWENHREQAILWRSLSLLQLPITLAAIILCMTIYSTRKNIINVPAKPLPGVYTVQEIPDSEFVDVSTEFVNLIATYQPAVARKQFLETRKMLTGPMLEKFDESMMVDELKAIENTSRTQIFFADPTKTEVIRNGRDVTVKFIGDRLKIIAGSEKPLSETSYEITMTTIPKNKLNQYGIVIKNAKFENLTENEKEARRN